MAAPALQGRALTRTLDDLNVLLGTGVVASEALQAFPRPREAGLWCDAPGGRTVATPQLVSLLDALPSAPEALAAIFSLVPELRTAWARVVVARLGEIGARGDLGPLCDAVSAAGALAAELVADLSPSLAPTAFGELERHILPAPAHEAQAFPVLLRALAVTAALQPLPARAPLPDVVWDDPSQTWSPGRLLRLPNRDDSPSASVLTGALDTSTSERDPMRWVLQRPWAFLLAQMVFTQEAWEAERVAGSLALELEQAHVALFERPPRVDVVVLLPTGEEVRCGSLGEFVQRTLGQLGVVILSHRISASALDDHLGEVIEILLRREIWRFDHGTGGRRPGYAIHPAFSDTCYRALGSRAFYRLGSPITAAIRRVAETWARDRIARAGSPDGTGAP